MARSEPGRVKERALAAVAHLNRKGHLTIPAHVRRADSIDPDQVWFWTPAPYLILGAGQRERGRR